MISKFLFGISGGKTRFVTYTAVVLAVTVAAQYASSFGGQLLTGSVVNLCLLLAVISCGVLGGTIVGVVTPFIALAIGINPNLLLVPFIAFGNAILVWVYSLGTLVKTDKAWQQYAVKAFAVVLGALLKFVFMRLVCVGVIFPLFVDAGLLNPPMLNKLADAWGILQMFTALIGGAVAIILDAALIRRNLLPAKQK